MNVSGSASSRSISSSPKRTNGNSGQQQYVSVGGNDDFNDEDRIEMGAMEEGFPIMANNSSESNNRRRGLAAKSQVG